ncbi:major histocompatibility complex class I-related gene protein-like isoform X2 [Poeciliopsis prolifica]|uniref:major histocompatibility complex class I-related gene protein-like isoform X2 n=1 Tax=Poeciliopsis prolifica TaxID=188132 RepID=UPI0024136219|nr:major histocompatibility complex class I-related gene protein-like isoform X2 [Poeciliopsis prolifica]
MGNFVFLLLLGIHNTAAVSHSMKYFYTASSKVPNFPEFVAVASVDDVQMVHYDSDSGKAEPKQDWMRENMDPLYWEREAGKFRRHQQTYKASIEILKQRFNQTGGVHVYQWMYGCEWDEETKVKKGFMQYGYDGEDFIAFDLSTKKWIAPTPQAIITKNKWDNNIGWIIHADTFLNQRCPDWIKTYMIYGRTSLMRTDKPSVSFLQKSSSSPISCFATGFYPNKAEMFWRKDGEEIHVGVDKGEILPNNDGSFQMSVDLDLPSVSSEDWNKYDCVFQLSGVDEDIVTKLEKNKILTNEWNWITVITTGAVIIAAVVVAAVGVIFRKPISEKIFKAKWLPTPVSIREVQEIMIPKQNGSSASCTQKRRTPA